MRKLLPVFVALLVAMATLPCMGIQTVDDYRFINFSAREGLADRFVYSICQDRAGFIWVGGNNGLYRFDGIRFRNFKSPLDRAEHQIGNILQVVYYDPLRNYLWLGSQTTLQWLDLNTFSFHSPDLNNPIVDEMIRGGINTFYRDSKRQLWISTMSGQLYHYDESMGSAHSVPLPESPSAEPKEGQIVFLGEYGHSVWLAKNDFIVQIAPGGNQLRYTLPNPTANTSKILGGCIDSASACVWLTRGKAGIARFDLIGHTVTFEKAFPFNNIVGKTEYLFIKNVELLDPGHLWIADNRLCVFEISTSQLSATRPYVDEFDLRPNNIVKLFNDRQGNLWIGSYDRGLSLHPYQNHSIRTYPLVNPQGYSIEPIASTWLPNSKDFIITGPLVNGVARFSWEQKKLYFVKPKDGDPAFSYGCCTTRDGKVYITLSNKMYQYDPQGNQLWPITFYTEGHKTAGTLQEIIADGFGNLIAASSDGSCLRISPDGGKANPITAKPEQGHPLGHIQKVSLKPSLLDHAGNVWFTNTEGIYILPPNSLTAIRKAYIKAENTGAGITQSDAVAETDDGHIWITTRGGGVFEYIQGGGHEKIKHLHSGNSNIPVDYCGKIVKDSIGRLWIFTLQGLIAFDPKTYRATSELSPQQGLFADYGYTINLMPDQRLLAYYFGGISVIDLKTYPFNTRAEMPLITQIKVMDQPVNTQAVLNDTNLRLNYRENFFQFDFTTPNYCNSNFNQFKYKLEGADVDWIYCSNRNSVSYSGLAPGKYTFHLAAANNNGVWSTRELKIKINITPPFWGRWWFYVLLLGFASAIIYFWNRMLIKGIRKEESLKTSFNRQIAEMELKALRAQMNPHFIFNSLNSIQKFVLKNDQFTASQYLTKFSRLIRYILDHSVQNTVTLASEIELLRLYIEIESLRFDSQFNFNLEVDEQLDTHQILIPSMLIQPYAENAIWHGLLNKEIKGSLNIKFTRWLDKLKVVVDDNGIGRTKAAELQSGRLVKHHSYGMKITEDRIKIINQLKGIDTRVTLVDKQNADGSSAGTRIIILIPLQIN